MNNLKLWPFTDTGDWEADNAKGRDIARQLCQAMNDTGNYALLGHMVIGMQMGASDKSPGIEAGFFHQIAIAACETIR